MSLYCVVGVRHECFVQAETPEDAVKVAARHVHSWEGPSVFAAEWKDGVLQPVEGETLYSLPEKIE